MLTSIRLRLRSVRSGDDRGVSLTELLVVMGIMTVVGALATTFFVGNQKASRITLERGYNTSAARVTLDSWTSLLRVADSPTPGATAGRFLRISPNEITFYANIGNRDGAVTSMSPPTLIDLSLLNGNLVEKRYSPATGSLTTTRTLATHASTTDSSGWVFIPYIGNTRLSTDADCLSAGSPDAGFCSLSNTDGSGTAAGDNALTGVNRVDISFGVTDSANLAPTSFTSSVSISGGTS